MKIRVATANLWAGGATTEGLAELIEDQGPDVLAVQELSPEQADVIERFYSHGLLEPEAGYDGMGIALRWPAAVERLPLRARDARLARLDPRDWKGLERAVELVNVHVQAPHSIPTWRTLPRRRDQLRGLLEFLQRPPAGARIVCGDLNATPIWPVYRRLAGHLEDLAVAHAALQGGRAAPTWGPWPGSPRLFRIDHVLGEGVTALDVRVVRVAGSDHSAVVVDVEVPGADAD